MKRRIGGDRKNWPRGATNERRCPVFLARDVASIKVPTYKPPALYCD